MEVFGILLNGKKKKTKNTFHELRKQRKLIFQDKSVFIKNKNTCNIFDTCHYIYIILSKRQ